MVASQLRPSSVDDPRVVAAMASVPRELFLPAELTAVAYRDTAIPVGAGRAVNAPLATGRLLTEAELAPGDHVLLIGAAAGYAAALLAGLVAQVVAVESDARLFALAQAALVATPNVLAIHATLTEGHAAGAPYDVLVIDGAVEEVPATLRDQLRVGGRVVTGLIEHGVTRLAAGVKTGSGFGLATFADADCVHLPGFARPAGFRF